MKNRFSVMLLFWYSHEKRALPWRETTDPYKIWISEIILQQTRVDQGLSYYLRFIDTFPTIRDLAAADEEHVLLLWQGLGYYSRARNLMAASHQVMEQYEGRFPTDYEGIKSLKGVGDYTAAAIASFAYRLPYAAVDGNVYRVLARIFAIATPIDTLVGKRYFQNLANELLSVEHPDLFNQAMMELGAICCLPRSPHCDRCPMNTLCTAYATHTIGDYPVKSKKTKVRNRYLNFLYITNGEQTYVEQRKDNDIWQSLYQFPMVETAEPVDFSAIAQSSLFDTLVGEMTYECLNVKEYKHQLSHQTLYARMYHIALMLPLPICLPYVCVSLDELANYPIPRLLERYLEEL